MEQENARLRRAVSDLTLDKMIRTEAARSAQKFRRRITALLRDSGWADNVKRVERIWRPEGLKVSQMQPKTSWLWLNDGSCIRLRPERPNHIWSYDFVESRTHDGRKFRMLNLIDELTRECSEKNVRMNGPMLAFENTRLRAGRPMGEESKARQTAHTVYDYFGDLIAPAILGLTLIATVPTQFLSWLRTGTIPPRDLYWLTADVRCAATNGEARGFEGMDLCRLDYIAFTDWLGPDQLLNFVFDLHLFFAAMALVIIAQLMLALLWEGTNQ